MSVQRSTTHILLALALGASAGAAGAVALAQQTAQGPARANVPSAQKDEWMRTLSNHGRWGADDELGALNLVTAAKRQQALSLARTGTVVSLARAISTAPKSDAIRADGKPDGRPFFEIRYRAFPDDSFFAGFASDVQEFAMHGALLTHLDALCHDSYGGRHYNGFAFPANVDPVTGCTRLGVANLREGIVTRGVLIDLPRLKGGAVAAGTRLTPADIAAWEAQTGARISSGDAIFLYTGRRDGRPETGAGYDLSVIPFLKARDVAVVGSDGANADHQLTLSGLGVYLIDNVDLSRLADTAASNGRWEFLLVVSPIPVPGATGSLVNPLAIF